MASGPISMLITCSVTVTSSLPMTIPTKASITVLAAAKGILMTLLLMPLNLTYNKDIGLYYLSIFLI